MASINILVIQSSIQEARVVFQANKSGICGFALSTVVQFHPVSILPPMLHIHISLIFQRPIIAASVRLQ